jgi:hypothetical protein
MGTTTALILALEMVGKIKFGPKLQMCTFSYYHNQPDTATKPIEAGAKLFGNYSNQWFCSREHHFGSSLPNQSNYASAGQLI